jgi:hypothetical protein
MKPLASRKQLLIAESELNRVQLVSAWQTMAGEVHGLTRRVRTAGSFASAAASLVAGLASFRCKKSAPAAEKPSWLQTFLKGAGLVSTFWQSFRPSARKQPDK